MIVRTNVSEFEIKIKSMFVKMEDIRDPFEHEVVQYLPVGDLLRLCETNREWRSFCAKNETWDFLLERDFKIKVEGNARYHYEANYKIWKWRNLVGDMIDERDRYEDEQILVGRELEDKLAEIYQRPFLAMLDLARWDLVDDDDFPNLNIDMMIHHCDSVGYIFLRRIISLYYSQPFSFWDGVDYPIYRQVTKIYVPSGYLSNYGFLLWTRRIDQIVVRCHKFVEKILTNKQFGINFVENINSFLPFTFPDMMSELDLCRNPIHSGTTFETILQNFRDHPSNDILLQHIDLGIPPVTL